MRNAFINHLARRVQEDGQIFLVVGDLGYSVVDPFVEKCPDRFLNAGVAEQNMTSVACGLAREGYKVFTYSIANFTTLRCLEQIRNDICYHGLPVCVVSVGGGFMYGSLGPTHHATEDIGILRTLPGMRVFVPFSQASACCALDEVLRDPGPAYIRLGRQGHAVESVSGNGLTQVPLRAETGEEKRHAVISVGKISDQTLDYAASHGADLYALCRIKPLPNEEVGRCLGRYETVTVMEDHQREGGAFSAIAEMFSDVRHVGLAGQFCSDVASEDELRERMMRDDAKDRG